VPDVDIADDTYVACPPAALAGEVADPASWARWWPDLRLDVTRDRGVKGMQWAVRGALTGSMEIWLERAGTGGTVVHWFLRADRPAPVPPRRAARDRDRRVRAWKGHAFALKDRAEGAERVT
jgi:hypothetical protein